MSQNSPGEQPHGWHLDKKVPISLILTIVAQIFAFGYVSATQNERINALEKNSIDSQKAIMSIQILSSSMESMRDDVKETKQLLHRMEDRMFEQLQQRQQEAGIPGKKG